MSQPTWETRVNQLERDGLTRSDAQAVVDAEDQKRMSQQTKCVAIGTCVENPFQSIHALTEVIDRGKPVTRRHFLRTCEVDHGTRSLMRRFPSSYVFYRSGQIWFYEWSRIEHFYQEPHR